jgi:peptidoglycan/xylan/chitin deacetylase (PgdA/CDA1 family)
MSWPIWLIILAAAPWFLFYVLWRIRFKKPDDPTVPVLAYHQVGDRFDWSITRQKTSQFERGVRFLLERGYRSIRLEELLGRKEDADEKRIAITFDDAYEDVYRNAFPVLQQAGFTACIFVVAGYVGKQSEWDYTLGRDRRKHLSWDQMREMAQAGFEFGSHTVNHPDLTRIPVRFVRYELEKSKRVLEERLGQRIDFLSYPFGRYNPYVQEEAQRAGYRAAFTMCSPWREKGRHHFSLSRSGVYLLDSPLSLGIKLNRGRLFWIEDIKGRIINRFPDWTVALKGSPRYEKVDAEPFGD